MIRRKTTFLTATALAFAGMLFGASPAHAEVTETVGTVVAIYPDPGNHFVFSLSKPGRCGNVHFHIDRSQSNAKEVIALVLMTYATKEQMGVSVKDCAKDDRGNILDGRNIISHGWVRR